MARTRKNRGRAQDNGKMGYRELFDVNSPKRHTNDSFTPKRHTNARFPPKRHTNARFPPKRDTDESLHLPLIVSTNAGKVLHGGTTIADPRSLKQKLNPPVDSNAGPATRHSNAGPGSHDASADYKNAMELIDHLQKENQQLKNELSKKNHGTVVTVLTGPDADAVHKPTSPHHLTNIDYFRRIFGLTGQALAKYYRKWVNLRERVKPRTRVGTLGRDRSPADADTLAVLKHAAKKPGWYAKQLHMDKKDFKEHVSQLRTMRNVKPQKCSQFHVARAMFCAYQIARTTPRMFALKKLKKRYERQNKIELFSLLDH